MTTPTEKDAMALAVLSRTDECLRDEMFSPHHPARVELNEARAHLASRIAELEAEIETHDADRTACHDAYMGMEARATRAEAELAAVRNVLTSIRDSTFRSALILRGMAQRGLDAARGGE